MRLQAVLARGQNNFDLLRLFAAIAVMYGHSFWVFPAHGRTEPILAFTGLEYSGSFGVYTFFLLSGILVSMSCDRQQSMVDFVVLRLARIFPGLIVSMTLIVFLVGPLFSALSIIAYLSDAQTYRWWLKTTTLLTGVGTYLPGLFTKVALKNNIDAPVWTLPMEIKCYMLVLTAGLLHCIGKKAGTILVCAAAFCGFLYMWSHPNEYFFGDFITRVTGYTFYPFLVFLIGMLAYAFRDVILLDIRFAIVIWIAYFALHKTEAGSVLLYVAFLYSVLTVPSLRPIVKLKLPGDYSYGVYLWGFIVQQVTAMYLPTIDNLLSLTFTIPITIGIAALSWHFVEKPALHFVRGWVAQRASPEIRETAKS
jgi:peptidoglycan/LPS O-acetylase OafA/YrhL